MEQNKTRAYILYALGEILLVVIGILIAFQIDNWNEHRVKKNQEIKILTQIQSDLVANASEIDRLIDRLEFSKSVSDSLLTSFRNNKEVKMFSVYSSIIHQRFFFNSSTSGYSLLGGALGTLLENDLLRNNIVQLYEDDFQEIDKRQEMLSNHLDESLSPQSNRLYKITQRMNFQLPVFDENEFDFYDPINFNNISTDLEYINTIVVLRRMYTIQLKQLDTTSNRLETVLNQIEQELNTLK